MSRRSRINTAVAATRPLRSKTEKAALRLLHMGPIRRSGDGRFRFGTRQPFTAQTVNNLIASGRAVLVGDELRLRINP